MNDNKAFCILGSAFFAFLTIGVACKLHTESATEIEAIKSGLVQKIDPETKLPIWTKP